jgi:AcrR family transcriptional regulator
VAKESARRSRLAESATDYVLEHGLIGLSLRPLAAALGTSDRMLLYHFAGKDDLIAAVLRTSTDRAIAELGRLPATTSVREAVVGLWTASTDGPLERCQRMYVEAAALGLLGREPYVGVVREANAAWTRALVEVLVAAGCAPSIAGRAANLLDAALMGLQLDLPLARGTADLDRSVADLADAVALLADNGLSGQGRR